MKGWTHPKMASWSSCDLETLVGLPSDAARPEGLELVEFKKPPPGNFP